MENCQNQIDCSSCKNCVADGSDNRRHFFLRPFGSRETLRFSPQIGHLLFVLEGDIQITETENTHMCGENRMALLACNKEHRIVALTRGTMLVLDFPTHYHVCDDIQAEDVWQVIRTVKYRFNTLEMKPPMVRFAESVMYYVEQEACCNHLFDAKAVELSVLFRLFYPEEDLVRFFYPVLYKDLALDTLVRKNHARAKTVQELADLCGYSLPNFKKLFTKHFGMPPYQWMLEQKSATIRSRLLDRTVPIKVIAAEFGFTDQSHLNAFCKRYLNATPLRIRNGPEDKPDR